MSTRDVFSLMFMFGMFLLAFLTFIFTIMKHWFDMQNKKK